MKSIIYLLAFICVASNSYSQKDSTNIDYARKKERQFCLNTTPLLSQIIPFNNIDPFNAGPFNIATKRFNSKNVAYRFGIGLSLTSSRNSFLNMRHGYEKRKIINSKWIYSHGLDFFVSLGNLNIPNNYNSNRSSESKVGLAPFWSLEYNINDKLSISTETSLLIDLVDEFTIQFIPPIALYLNIKH